MSQKILVIGANSALAKVVIPVLAANNTVITAGRQDCDVYCDITKELSLPKADVVINFAAAFSGKFIPRSARRRISGWTRSTWNS